jgi:Protein kinase domain
MSTLNTHDDQQSKIKVEPSDFEKTSKIEQGFDLVKKESDQRFGDVALIHNKKTGETAMLKESVSNSEKEASDDILQVKRRMQLNHPYMQKMLDWSCHKQSNFCSKFFKVRGFYEFPKNDLKKEIQTRKKSNKDFNHEELTHLVYQNLLALEYLQNNNVSFGDLRPAHISVDSLKQEYKLLDRLNDPSTTFQANVNNIMANRPLYCSPVIFESIKKNKKNLDHNAFKSDCFSLGMILLEAGTMSSVQDVYDNESCTVNQSAIDAHMNLIRQKY